MPVIMFKPQFAALVRSGAKLQTVRPVRKHPIKVGDALSLRQWSGRPYCSKQVLLRDDTCRETYPIRIDVFGMLWAGPKLFTTVERDEFARADGFPNYDEMVKWFREQHGLPFAGMVISWAGAKP